MTNNLVSIVVATYKQARYLKTSLLSCFNQTHANYEVIVVSVENDRETHAVLENFSSPFKHIVSEKADYVYQRNLGIKNANGEWITLMDSDDWFLPNKLASDLAVAMKTNAVLVYSAFLVADENLNPTHIMAPPEFSREELLQRCFVTDYSLVKKDIYDEFGLFHEPYKQLAFYNHWLKMAEVYPQRMKLNKNPTFIYRKHPAQMHKGIDRKAEFKLRMKIVLESLARKPVE